MLIQGMQIDNAETSDADGGTEVVEVVQPMGTCMMKTSSGREVKKVSYADNSDDDDDVDYHCDKVTRPSAEIDCRSVGYQYEVGQKLMKEFPPHGLYEGVITQLPEDGCPPLYHVQYTDGDKEDMTPDDISKYVLSSGSSVPRSRRPGASAGRSRKKNDVCAKLCSQAKGISLPSVKSFPRTKKGKACQLSMAMMNEAFNYGRVPANEEPGVFVEMDERSGGEGEDT